jgi:hyaluronate lyase
VLCEERSGAWPDINEGSVTDPLTRRYVTLWASHGTDPQDAGYVYLLMPGASAHAVAARAAGKRWLQVDANTADQQAVTIDGLGLSAANFWAAGTAGDLSATAPSSVLVRRRGRTAQVHVSEPTRTGEAFEVTWHRSVRKVLSADEGIKVLETDGRAGAARTAEKGGGLRLRVNAGTGGATLSCRVLLR